MSRKNKTLRAFLHQNENPTIEQAWNHAWKGAQKAFHARSMQELEARILELEECLKEARANMEDWGNYVPEYFQEKHGLSEDLAAIDRVIEGQQPSSTPE